MKCQLNIFAFPLQCEAEALWEVPGHNRGPSRYRHVCLCTIVHLRSVVCDAFLCLIKTWGISQHSSLPLRPLHVMLAACLVGEKRKLVLCFRCSPLEHISLTVFCLLVQVSAGVGLHLIVFLTSTRQLPLPLSREKLARAWRKSWRRLLPRRRMSSWPSVMWSSAVLLK